MLRRAKGLTNFLRYIEVLFHEIIRYIGGLCYIKARYI